MSGNFKMNITLGNDSMKEPSHVAEILRQVAYHIEENIASGAASMKRDILDDDGNTAGSWSYFNEGDDDDE